MSQTFLFSRVYPAVLIPLLICGNSWAFSPGTEPVFINEIHYDNSGGDVGEAIEIAGPAGTNLNGWSLVLYNGSSSQLNVYNTLSLSGTLADQCNGYGSTFVSATGLQNGAPDGIALVDGGGNLIQFLSYEGSFTAIDGPAINQTSTNIGVTESSSTQIGESLQLSGNGTVYGDFSWNSPASDNFGAVNTNQNFNGMCDGGGEPPVAEIGKIHEIQGSGESVNSGTYTVEAIVTGDFQGADQLSGFFIQEEDADADSNSETSEGIFVFCDSCPVDVNVGDLVSVTGSASDFFDMSQLTSTNASEVTVLSSGNTLPTAVQISLPVPVSTTSDSVLAEIELNLFYETLEGMLVEFVGALTVDEYFELDRYGQIVLTEGGRPRQFTEVSQPDANGLIAHQIDLASRKVILDDDNNEQNSPLDTGLPVYHPLPGFSTSDFIRGGDSIDNLTGVLHWSWAGSGGTDAWRIRPVAEQFSYSFNHDNPRVMLPEEVDGTIKVASFNLLNFFSTLDDSIVLCGPALDQGCRGANSASELERQSQKLVSAICTVDADIVGLVEIENNEFAATDLLLSQLNTQCGVYDVINSGFVGGDAIKVAIIYKPATVTPNGNFAILDTGAFVDPNNLGDDKNRAALAQTFTEQIYDRDLTVVVNHLKSKGSSCGTGDDDISTGQGNCNATRTLGALEQAAWLETDPTGTGASNILIIGDLNAYRQEDPIMAFKDAGYTDLLGLLKPLSYTYLFDGQIGTLDYALSNAALLPFISGVTSWHINADEVDLFDYNDTIVDPNEAFFHAKPAALPLFENTPFRSSDHDPVIVGIDFSLGDLNGDGCIGRDDVFTLIHGLRSGATDPSWDLNEDGRISRADIRTLIGLYSNPGGFCAD